MSSRPPVFHILLSTVFGVGYCPVAPGTVGAAVGLGLWWIAYSMLAPDVLFLATLVSVVIVTVVGAWTTGVVERYWGEDPRRAVIDEVVGTWIALLAAPCGDYTWFTSLVAFSVFRLIDIYKPLGCRWIDRNVRGGWGAMLDDVLAGVYAFIVTALLAFCF